MNDLVSFMTEIGLQNVNTYIQSGNIVFQSSKTKEELINAIQDKIKQAYKFEVPVQIINKEELPEFINFKLDLNGKIVQDGNTKDMIFSVDKLLEYVSRFYTLKIGDLLFTGTPVGVGKVKIGDRLKGYLEDHLMFDFEIK